MWNGISRSAFNPAHRAAPTTNDNTLQMSTLQKTEGDDSVLKQQHRPCASQSAKITDAKDLHKIAAPLLGSAP
jgi:hypothetical protein